MSDMYFPTEFSENELDQLSRVDAVNIILGELERIASRPAAENAANLSLLAASPVVKKAGVTAQWLREMCATVRRRSEEKARAAAIADARQNGTLTASEQLWVKEGSGARYALPEGILFEKSGEGYRFNDVVFGPIGPALYPIEELENGTIRLTGWDRWGRGVDLTLSFADLTKPTKSDIKLIQVGCRMDQIGMWCGLVNEILSSNDLRVPDPEPIESEDEEMERVRDALRRADWFLNRDQCPCVDPTQFEREFGKLELAVKRRWVENGWLLRATDDRHFTQKQSRRGRVQRVYVFAEQVLAMLTEKPQNDTETAGLDIVAGEEAEAVHQLNAKSPALPN